MAATMDEQALLYGGEIDRKWSLRPGTSERLAKRGLLPHVELPDGRIRFRWRDVEACLQEHQVAHSSVPQTVPVVG